MWCLWSVAVLSDAIASTRYGLMRVELIETLFVSHAHSSNDFNVQSLKSLSVAAMPVSVAHLLKRSTSVTEEEVMSLADVLGDSLQKDEVMPLSLSLTASLSPFRVFCTWAALEVWLTWSTRDSNRLYFLKTLLLSIFLNCSYRFQPLTKKAFWFEMDRASRLSIVLFYPFLSPCTGPALFFFFLFFSPSPPSRHLACASNHGNLPPLSILWTLIHISPHVSPSLGTGYNENCMMCVCFVCFLNLIKQMMAGVRVAFAESATAL